LEERAESRAWILAMAVQPEQRERGVGSALLSELEHRFRQAGRHDIWMASYPTAYIVPGVDERAYAGGLAFLQARGYRTAYAALAMEASLWPPKVPEHVSSKERELASQGIRFHPYSSRWLSATRRFLRSQVPWDWEWLALRNLRRIHEGTFSPEQFLLATSEEEVVGCCQNEGEHFGPFGVAQEFQGRGIGTVLLTRTLRSMARQGQHNAWVLWTGDRAARLYARFGFVASRRFAVLHKELC
jgi:GNAT superfamily N-acetyltransferase